MLRDVWKKLSRHYPRLKLKENRLDRIRTGAGIKLHLGCGKIYKPGYVNVDAFSEIADVKADIVRLDSFEDHSVDLVETHHVLEHLAFADARRALQEWAKKLKRGGFVIISVPDFDGCYKLWKKSPYEERWNKVIRMIYGSQEHAGMFHKSAYTPQHLSDLLTENGLAIEFVLRNYPDRPTPSFLVLACKP